ncbi:MAG: DNA polymerase III subunit delta [Oscillospiraceae bacterium]|nr:DNA polymerase III subunit delta [Oscillospiraceae bacterium]
MSLSILRQELKSDIIRNIYLFYGPETYLLNYYVDNIKVKLLDPMTRQVNLNVFEDAADIQSIVSCCTTLPMFAEKRVVVLKNTGLLKPSKTGGLTGEPTAGPRGVAIGAKGQTGNTKAEILCSLFKDFSDSTCLIIIEESVDKRLKLYKEAVKYGLPVEFPLQSITDLEVWVKNLCHREGKAFEGRALTAFMQKCEPFMADIKNEIDKLILYSNTRNIIGMTDIDAVCSFSIKTRVFDLIDTIATGNRLKAIQELRELIAVKVPEHMILAMISKHFIQLRHLKSLADNKVSMNDATSALGLKPYPAKKMWRQCTKFQFSKLDDVVLKCYRQDAAIKSGEISADCALELLIASI